MITWRSRDFPGGAMGTTLEKLKRIL